MNLLDGAGFIVFVANTGVFDANRFAEIKQFVSVPSTRWRLNIYKKIKPAKDTLFSKD